MLILKNIIITMIMTHIMLLEIIIGINAIINFKILQIRGKRELFLNIILYKELRMNRRLLLKRIGNLSVVSSLLPFINIHNSNAKSPGRVVILGAGWGGLSAAKTIKKISPEVEVIIIDQNRQFTSCPMSNWVIGQLKMMEDITLVLII